MSDERKTALGPRVAEQLHVSTVEILQSFRQEGWSILYVNPRESEGAFLFYSGDPFSNRYVSLWSGVATKAEEAEVKQWVFANAPGIPERLAACFAWHVTVDRDR